MEPSNVSPEAAQNTNQHPKPNEDEILKLQTDCGTLVANISSDQLLKDDISKITTANLSKLLDDNDGIVLIPPQKTIFQCKPHERQVIQGIARIKMPHAASVLASRRRIRVRDAKNTQLFYDPNRFHKADPTVLGDVGIYRFQDTVKMRQQDSTADTDSDEQQQQSDYADMEVMECEDLILHRVQSSSSSKSQKLN